jgi:hypothetical protein
MNEEKLEKITQFSLLLEAEAAIAANYESACAVLVEEEMALTVNFLIKLDNLAMRYDFSPREIIALLQPEHPLAHVNTAAAPIINE